MSSPQVGDCFEKSSLAVEAHGNFIARASSSTDTLEHAFTEHLRLSGMYWGLCALSVMGKLDALGDAKREEILDYVERCRGTNGGYGGGVGHDAHALYTLSAVQIYALFDVSERLDVDAIVKYVQSLQLADGSFQGDEWGEVDTRFTYCVLSTLRLLNRLDAVDVDGNTAAMLAAENDHAGCLNQLRGAGCDMEIARESDGATAMAIHRARVLSRIRCIED